MNIKCKKCRCDLFHKHNKHEATCLCCGYIMKIRGDKMKEEKSIVVPTTTDMTETYGMCPGCGGSGVQTDNNGIKIICPICKGSGKWHKHGNYEPWYEPNYPMWGPVWTCYGPR